MEKISREYATKSVLVVTHQVPYKLFRALFEHLGEEEVLALEPVKNCGMQIYEIQVSDKYPFGRMQLKAFNVVAYSRTKDVPCSERYEITNVE